MSNVPAVPETTLTPETMERLIMGGDLSKLSSSQRLAYCQARCEAAGLDIRGKPFEYISLQGKLVLYATKAATDQLIAKHRLTVEILDRTHHAELGIYEVRCRVTFPDGHHCEDVGMLSIKGLVGDPLCNAMMKATTKAKRRTVLSGCGLGLLDESELETIPNVVQYPPQPSSQIPGGIADATGKEADAYERWAKDFCSRVNARFLDTFPAEHNGEMPDKELLNHYQLTGHLLKWAAEKGFIPEGLELNASKRFKVAAVVFRDHISLVKGEATAYVGRVKKTYEAEWQEATKRLTGTANGREPGDDSEEDAWDALDKQDITAQGD